MDHDRDRRESHAHIARLEVQVENLEKDVSELKADVKQVLAQLAEAKGSWRTLLAVAGFAGTVGALGAKVAGVIFK